MERTRVRVKKIDENSIIDSKTLNKRSSASLKSSNSQNKRVVLQTVKDNRPKALKSRTNSSIQIYQDRQQQEKDQPQNNNTNNNDSNEYTHIPNSDDTIEQDSDEDEVLSNSFYSQNQIQDLDDYEYDDDDENNNKSTSLSTSLTNPNALYPVHDKQSQQILHKLKLEFQNKPGIYDGDDEDTFDVSMVCEYSNEIFVYMRKLELTMRPDPGYMDNQTEIHWSMRSILVDWLVQVHARFNLLPETLFLTINYMDRFLSIKTVSLSKFQLVGAVALFVAAKYEEINCPSVQEIAYMVDHGYTEDEILKAERYMIDLLEFNLGWPGPMSFLRRTSKADDYDLETRTLAKYLLEISIMDERFVGTPPSWLAASAHCLARKILEKGGWTDDHVYFGGYTESQLQPAIEVLIECCKAPQEHHKAIYDKYADRRYKRASLYVAQWMEQQF